jgi:dTDP-3-amino-3,4,6-trideoxy-alpha-D-glucose transaminase
LQNHGRISKYRYQEPGRSSRLDTLQAEFLSIKLRKLPEWTQQRIALAKKYDEALVQLSDTFLPLSRPPQDGSHVYHLYVVLSKKIAREKVMSELADLGIETLIHYPEPLHHSPAFQKTPRVESLRVSEQSTFEMFSLPFDPLMSESEVIEVIEALKTIERKIKKETLS